ncbi:hypothetical protein [Rickettsia endosymbiont of Polydrusus tereticollis]|uniref:hypothetical protein n=1 Tax=Rickettsia endosymbiont of Polydrusus tereticollis TaxID=3066251 RepID=UPI003132BCA4
MKKNLRNKFSLFKYFLLICVSITTLTFGINEGFAQPGDDLEGFLEDFRNHPLSKPKTTRQKREVPSNPPMHTNRERDAQSPTVSEKPKAKKWFSRKKAPTEEKPTEEKPATIPNGFSLAQDPPNKEGYKLKDLISDVLKNNKKMAENSLLTRLKQQCILQEHNERFDEYLNNNDAITALGYAENTGLSLELKKTAIDKILSDLKDQNIKQILFVGNLEDVRILDFTKPINKENRPILAAITQNASEEQKNIFFDRVAGYVDRNLITLETQKLHPEARLILTQLKAINDKKGLKKFLLRKGKIKEKLQVYYKNGKYGNIPQKVIAEINKKLKADSLITNDLNQNEIVALINGFNKTSLEKSINVILTPPEIIKKEIKKKLLPTPQPVLTRTASTGTTPPPRPNAPPPIHNNYNINLNDLKKSHPKLHKLYEKLAEQGKHTQQNSLSTKVNKADEITEPQTEYGQLYKAYLTESNKDFPKLGVQLMGAEINIVNTIRQILTTEYKDDFGAEKLISLFSEGNQDSSQATEIKSKALQIYQELSKDLYTAPIIKRTKKDAIPDKLFQESSDDAMKRLLLPSSGISKPQKEFVQTIQIKEQKEQELANCNDRLEQLRFIVKNFSVFGNQKLNDNIEELVNDPNKLTNINKVNILFDKDKIITTLKNIDSVSDEQINNLRTNIIKTIDRETIKAFASDNNINSADFIRVIQSTKPEILREFLAAKVIIEENKLGNALSQNVPSIANFSQEEVTQLSQRMTIAGLMKSLVEIGQENIVAQQQSKQPITTGNAPPPPPPPSIMTPSELENLKLKAAGVNDDLIKRALKLKADNNRIPPKAPTTTNEFNSYVGKKYFERINTGSSAAASPFVLNIKRNGVGEALNNIILESVLEI